MPALFAALGRRADVGPDADRGRADRRHRLGEDAEAVRKGRLLVHTSLVARTPEFGLTSGARATSARPAGVASSRPSACAPQAPLESRPSRRTVTLEDRARGRHREIAARRSRRWPTSIGTRRPHVDFFGAGAAANARADKRADFGDELPAASAGRWNFTPGDASPTTTCRSRAVGARSWCTCAGHVRASSTSPMLHGDRRGGCRPRAPPHRHLARAAAARGRRGGRAASAAPRRASTIAQSTPAPWRVRRTRRRPRPARRADAALRVVALVSALTCASHAARSHHGMSIMPGALAAQAKNSARSVAAQRMRVAETPCACVVERAAGSSSSSGAARRHVGERHASSSAPSAPLRAIAPHERRDVRCADRWRPISMRSGTPRMSQSANFQPGCWPSRSSSLTRKPALRNASSRSRAAADDVGARHPWDDRHDDRLDRRHLRREPQPAVVAVHHDQRAEHAPRHAPRGRPRELFGLVFGSVNVMSYALREILPRSCDVADCNALPSGISASIEYVCGRAGKALALALLARVHGNRRRRSGRRRRRRRASAATSAAASASVACAVWPSCHRNSIVRRNGRVRFSQRITFAHWLMRIGRSRYDCTQSAYIVPIIDLGGRADRQALGQHFVAALRHPRHLWGEALDVLGLARQQRLGNQQRKIGVLVAGLFEAAVELGLQALPEAVPVRAQHDAAAHRRERHELGFVADRLCTTRRDRPLSEESLSRAAS